MVIVYIRALEYTKPYKVSHFVIVVAFIFFGLR